MPYSKNPHKYPADMQAVLDYLMQYNPPQVTLACEDRREAQGRRIQLQSYFRAVERHAQELKELADRVRQKMLAAQGKESSIAKNALEVDYREAKALAEVWEGRALAAMGWVVKAADVPPQVVVTRRVVSAGFGASIKGLLAAAPLKPPTPVVDDLEEQLAMIRQASEAMKNSGTN